MAIGLLSAIAGPLCGVAAARAEQRTEQRAAAPVPLAVRYKGTLDSEGLFALLKAFPEVATRRASHSDDNDTSVRVRAPRASLMQRGNPLPLRSEVLSSRFGMRWHPILGGMRPHMGVDLAAPTGTPVYATADGVVSAAGPRGGYGLSVTLEHAQGMETRYGHMSRLAVVRGQRVLRGEVIGRVGSTGLSTGPHLHYETRRQGQAVNPLPYMRRK